MAVLPLGTANDFANAIGVADMDLPDALRIAAEVSPTGIDVVQANERYFLNVATGGVGSSVTTETPKAAKKLFGKVAYLITGLREIGSLKAQSIALEAGDWSWNGRFLVLAIGNARFAGGGFDLCPAACLDDGLLELCVVPDADSENRSAPLREIIDSGIQGVTSSVVQRRVAEVTVSCDSILQLNLDGEPLEASKFVIRTRPEALRFHLPDRCPLSDCRRSS